MAHGLIRRIGDGETTSIWSDNWIPRDNFKCPVTSLVPNAPVKVAQLIDNTTASWNENLVRSVFTQGDAEAILRIPLCTRQVDDFWAWHEETRGGFSVRSAYRMILRLKHAHEAMFDEHGETSYDPSETKKWSMIWHLQVPSNEVFCLATRPKVHANWHCLEASAYGNGGRLSHLRGCRYLETCSHLLPDGG